MSFHDGCDLPSSAAALPLVVLGCFTAAAAADALGFLTPAGFAFAVFSLAALEDLGLSAADDLGLSVAEDFGLSTDLGLSAEDLDLSDAEDLGAVAIADRCEKKTG